MVGWFPIGWFPPSHLDFHIGSGFLERKSRVTVDAGPRTVDEGHRDVSLDLADPLQHGSPGPPVRYGHVPEGRLSAEAQEHKAPHRFSSVPPEGRRTAGGSCLRPLTLEPGRSGGRCNRTRCCPRTPTSTSA